MSNQNWQLTEGDPFAPAAPDTLAHLPSFHVPVTHPSAQLDTLDIVRAALEAAASKCEDLHLGDGTNSDWHCGVSDCAMFIRAIDPQTIIDAASGK